MYALRGHSIVYQMSNTESLKHVLLHEDISEFLNVIFVGTQLQCNAFKLHFKRWTEARVSKT